MKKKFCFFFEAKFAFLKSCNKLPFLHFEKLLWGRKVLSLKFSRNYYYACFPMNDDTPPPPSIIWQKKGLPFP